MARPAHGRKRQRLLAWYVILAVVAAALLAGMYWASRHFEASGREHAWVDNPQGIGQLRTVTYDDALYQERINQTVLLLMGIDRDENAAVYGARRGGQADFLLLLVIDHDDRTVRQLQIDRDTMANVTTLGVLGNPTGTKVMQICLSHGFGDGAEQSCEFTVEAVENLMQGIEIDGYFAMGLSSIAALNDALGGVTVTLSEDLTAFDPAMKAGATLTLTGEQAALWVRGRTQVGDETNASRMSRQKVYLDAASGVLKSRIRQDGGFVNAFVEAIKPLLVTNFSDGRIINEVNRAYYYDILPAERMAGEYTIGNDGFVEFHIHEPSLTDWILNNLYRRK